ncbi:MAG: 50S ribosomal protein L28 [Patescibacteria group bacterium]
MKTCFVCHKSSLVGGGYSNRIRATKFNPTGRVRRQPNLQWARLNGGGRVKICTRCLKSGRHLAAGSKTK